MDTLNRRQRSERMALVRNRDTKPEMVVRRGLHALGYRYRIHVGGLPGRPDLVFTKKRKAIFVNGCFWHRHDNCSLARLPKSRLGFWKAKLDANKKRDQKNLELLSAQGWDVMTVWECELATLEKTMSAIQTFLEEKGT